MAANDPLQSLFEVAAQALRENPGWLDELVDDHEAARVLSTTTATLATRRCRGGGVPFVKDGSRAKYRRRKLFERVLENERRSTSEA